MKIDFASRMNGFKPGIFNVLDDKAKEAAKSGRKIYNLSIGTPDFKPDQHVMEAVSKAALNPENYKYAINDLPELIEAVQAWYQRRYHVDLTQDEIMSVHGTQEGMSHLPLALCDPGDIVLVPDPCYPIFRIGPWLAGAEPVSYPLRAENGYLPDFDEIPADIAEKAKLMIVSYPLNPVCATADDDFYQELIRFANRYHIVICHDNAYSDIIYDGREGKSFLAYPGAKEVGVEFNSLSKTYNLTGARISFLVGNRDVVRQFRIVRSQIDYGVFLPVQYAAIAALTGPQDSVARQCREYQERRDALCSGFRSIGWDIPDSEGSMFVWAPIPRQYKSSLKFCLDLIEKTGVICTPGAAFGPLGEGYVRFALVIPADEIREMVKSVQNSGFFN